MPVSRRFPLLADVADLVLGRACLGCDAPGPSLCRACLRTLQRSPIVLPASGRMPRIVAATAYDGLARRAVIAYKEHADRSLAEPLGLLLADSIELLLRDSRPEGASLTPVPGHRHSTRGFDALGSIVRHASVALAARGRRVPVHHLIRPAAEYLPLKGLGRDQRFAQISGAFEAVSARRREQRTVIVVDDIVTTGATATEAVRVLLRSGVPVIGVATVAATPAGHRRLT